MMGHDEFKRKLTTVVTAYQTQLSNYLTEDSSSETSYDTDWTEDDSGDEFDLSEAAKKKRKQTTGRPRWPTGVTGATS